MDEAPHLSLKQKWQDHWDTRNSMFAPSAQMNILGMVFFLGFTASLMYTSLWILIPPFEPHNTNLKFYMDLAIYFIFVQSVLNWCLAARRSKCRVTANATNGVSRDENSVPEGWKNCLTCQLDVPPRAHHCKVCNMCVFKRDHHCFFTGTCVGFQNQRNFIVFTFYIAIGSVYGIVLLLTYFKDIWPMFTFEHGVNYLPFVAFWKLITGYVSGAHFLLLIQFYCCCLMFIVAGWFFVLEMYTVLIGITWHEAEKGIWRYQGVSTSSNVRSVFGPFWLIQFFIPIPTAQEGNAMQWETKKGSKTN